MSEEKKVVATDLQSIPADILNQAEPVETAKQVEAKPAEGKKAAEKPIKVTVKKLEVREKAEPRQAQKPEEATKPAEQKPAEPASSLTMSAVEKELNSIKQRLGAVETSQASAEARLKAIEANGVEISETLKALKEMQATAEQRLAKAEEAATDAQAAAKIAVNQAVQISSQQRTIAEAIVVTQQRQTPWGMFQAWRAARKLHAERERETMEELRKKEYEQSIKAVADGTFKPAEA